jgi:hypothetical protein
LPASLMGFMQAAAVPMLTTPIEVPKANDAMLKSSSALGVPRKAQVKLDPEANKKYADQMKRGMATNKGGGPAPKKGGGQPGNKKGSGKAKTGNGAPPDKQAPEKAKQGSGASRILPNRSQSGAIAMKAGTL